MKRLPLFLLAVIVVIISCKDEKPVAPIGTAPSDTAGTAKSTDQGPWVPIDSATEMKAWMEYATPGEMHKALAKSNGTWDGQTTMWMAKDAPPSISKSTMTNKMVLGGRYQFSSFKGEMMGQTFEGIAITGYDNHLKKFVSTWIDEMGTGIMKLEGQWDEPSKKITYTGKWVNPANNRECEMRQVYTLVDDNNEIMEMYGPDSKTGKEYKTMEIKLVKKK